MQPPAPPLDLSLHKRQMMWVNTLLKAIVFVLLLPGVVLSLPPGGTLLEKSVFHGVLFAVVNYFIYWYVLPLMERFTNPDSREKHPCPEGYEMCSSGDCRLASEVHTFCN